MKRRDLIRHLEQNGCQFFREGSRHTIYHNPAKNVAAAVPRHNEIGTPVARAICKELKVPAPAKK